MYTILVTPEDKLIATNRETIMHRSSLVRKLCFLVDPTFTYGNEELNMADYVCILEYRLPISNKYTPLVLTASEEMYSGKLQYVLAVDSKITSEVGDVQLKLTWTKPEMLASGSFNDHVRKTTSTTITVLPVEQWSDYIATSDLDNIVQMILTNQAQGEQLKLYADYLSTTKADRLQYNTETNELSLMSNGQKLNTVTLEDSCQCDDGVPVVEFSEAGSDSSSGSNDDVYNNVVEF